MPGREACAARTPGDPDADRHWLNAAIELSAKCSVSASAFSVGAVLVSAAGDPIATGYSRETGPQDHAEEVALRRAAGAGLDAATLYSSLEPCLRRRSRPVSCAQLIAASGLRRVVIAWLEPAVFQPGGGADWLTARGIAVVHLSDLAEQARSPNTHLLSP